MWCDQLICSKAMDIIDEVLLTGKYDINNQKSQDELDKLYNEKLKLEEEKKQLVMQVEEVKMQSQIYIEEQKYIIEDIKESYINNNKFEGVIYGQFINN